MITRLLAILAVTSALSIGAAKAEDEPSGDKPVAGAPSSSVLVDANEGSDGSKAAEETSAVKPSEEAAASPKAAENAAPKRPTDETPTEQKTTAQSSEPAESPKTAEAAADPKPADKAVATKPLERPVAPKPDLETAGTKRADEKPADGASAASPAPKAVRGAAIAAPAPRAASARPTAAERHSDRAVRVRASDRPVAVRAAAPVRVRPSRRSDSERYAAVESGQAPESIEVAQRSPAVGSGPITGGILCGGGSKWRCNLIEREHDKFYKFAKGHNWTDQTMATDFCATNRQMRVASATRIKSITGGCCGFTVVQVTCRR